MIDEICFFQINRLGEFCVFVPFHLPADFGTWMYFDPGLQAGRKGIPPDKRNPRQICNTKCKHHQKTQKTYRTSYHMFLPYYVFCCGTISSPSSLPLNWQTDCHSIHRIYKAAYFYRKLLPCFLQWKSPLYLLQ